MIQANELRLGNWFFDGEQYVRFKAFHNGKIYHTYGWCLPDGELHWQIPLTPEILEKAGFEKDVWQKLNLGSRDGATWELSYNSGVLFIHQHMEQYTSTHMIVELLKDSTEEERNRTAWVQKENSIIMPTLIKYLHQLQNLYFALTGTELQIEL